MSWDPLADQWERNFVLLNQYEKREGHSNVPRFHEEDGVKLGLWLATQRIRGKLDEERHNRLETMGVSWDPIADQWEWNFSLLEQYKEREGHCNVLKSHEEDGTKLGSWLNGQRHAYKKGKLDESYRRRFDGVGVISDRYADQWERSFALLEQYKERVGHCNVPRKHEEEGVKLGRWLEYQRQARKGDERCTLSLERIDRLDKVGIRW
mmetsp:Transcript_31213/g.91432  ORF Transcript_31213/g.91432 Transcript_31213/m.91432 type:complete len:208 (+) Transcript_31213:538-1161(+)